jgi:tetratricopeptide (TPR) repeat protein
MFQAELDRLQQPEVKRERQLLENLSSALEKYIQSKDTSSRQNYQSIFEQALALPKPSADVYSACATAANLLGHSQQAIALLKNAITEYPEKGVWGPKVPIKVSGYYRIGSIATRIGDSNEATFAYETAIRNSEDLEGTTFTKITCSMLLVDIANRLQNDKKLALKRCQEMIVSINSIDSSGIRDDESSLLRFLKDWALYEQKYLETGKVSSRQLTELSKQEYTLPYMLALTHATMSHCTMPEIEQTAESNLSSVDSILDRFALAFIYMENSNINPTKAEKYLNGIMETDSYFKVYAEAILKLVHEQKDEISKKIPILLQDLKQGNLKQRESAVLKLSRESGPEGIKALYQAQQDPNKYVRYAAACGLARWCRDMSVKPDFKIVLEAFTDDDPQIRNKASAAIDLSSCLEISPEEILAIIQLMKEHYSLEIKQTLEGFLSQTRTPPEIIEAAIPELANLFSHSNPDVRSGIFDIFRRIKLSKAKAVPVLLESLDNEDSTMQRRIIGFLGSLGPDAKQAIPKLTEYTKHKDVNIRNEAIDALQKISSGKTE